MENEINKQLAVIHAALNTVLETQAIICRKLGIEETQIEVARQLMVQLDSIERRAGHKSDDGRTSPQKE